MTTEEVLVLILMVLLLAGIRFIFWYEDGGMLKKVELQLIFEILKVCP